MAEIKIHCTWLRPGTGMAKIGDIEGNRNVEIYVDQMPTSIIPNNTFRIITILEPFGDLKNRILDYFNKFPSRYNHIFTYHQDILDSFRNSSLSVTPTTWVGDYVPGTKEYNVSSVFGNKHLSMHLPGLEGYNVRWELFTRKEELTIDKKFYLSSNSPIPDVDYSKNLVLGNSKNPMFNSQFHIAIENTNKIRNAFSEKIIDCFQTRTIPIYYGPENIGDFFNMEGIFYVRNASEIIEICNNLTPDVYNSKMHAIEDNYQRSMDYISFDKSMIRNVKKVLNK
jgi:hypothetical protein